MYQGKIDSDGLTYAPAGTIICENAVVERYLPLVRKVAWHVHGGHSSIDLEDLVQIGLIALIEASRVYEDKGASFSSYATTRVRGAMIDQLRKAATVSRRGMANKKAMEQARRALEAQLGRAAAHEEVARHMGLSPEDYFDRLASSRSLAMESLEDSYSDSSLLFADLAESADSEMESEQMLASLEHCLGELAEREAMVLQLYFLEERNLAEIAEILGIGSARVCQIKKRALEKVRERLQAMQF